MENSRDTFTQSGLLAPLLQQLIDVFDCGIAAIDSESKLVLTNDTARMTLSPLIHLGDIGDPVTANLTQFRAKWTTAFNQSLSVGFASFGIGAGDDRKSLALRRIVVAQNPQEIRIVLVIGPRRSPCSGLVLDELAIEARLTRAEQAIVALLAQGKSPGQVASLRRSSEATVRTQIKTILQKTGASSMRTLLLYLASMPPITNPGEYLIRVA